MLGAGYIIYLAKNLRTSRLVKNFISKEENCPNLKGFLLSLYTDKDFEDRVFSTFDADLNVSDSASPELKRLRNSLKSTKDNLKGAISKLLNDDSFTNHLQDTIYTTREGRTVFQVKAADKNKVAGIVHDISASNQTYFIEPSSLVPLNNKIRPI